MTTVAVDLQRLALHAPITVDCGFCGQPRGSDCRTSGGWYPLRFHAVRRHAVDGLTVEQQAEVVLAWQAERDQRGRQGRERMRRDDADPQKVADRNTRRAAMRQAWADINQQIREEDAARRAVCEQPFGHPAGCECRLGRPFTPAVHTPVGVLPVADLGAERVRRRPAAAQCGECVEGGYGPPCLKHFLDAEAAYERGLDV